MEKYNTQNKQFANHPSGPDVAYFLIANMFGNLREFVLTHVILTTGACGREALSST